MIVVIEFNPSIPNYVNHQNPTGKRVGNFAKSILHFANEINYFLAHATSTNLILVQQEFFETKISKLNLEQALDDSDTIQAVFAGYDGSLNIIGARKLDYPWHGLSRDLNSLSLPKIIQRFPEELSLFGKITYRFLWFKQYWLVALRNRTSKLF